MDTSSSASPPAADAPRTRHATPVEIDGSRGEGGGQILRTSLALAAITGRPLRMHRIRAGRGKPGLRRQHVACVEAAARLCHAEVRGGTLGSQEIELIPGPITGGALTLDIGTAGSTTLVVQTILVPAIVAGVALHAEIIGGTHNPKAPPFEFLERVWLPHLRTMGADVDLALDRHGFASDGEHTDNPKHRGQLTLRVGAGRALGRLDLVTAGPITARHATAVISRLPTHVAQRELAVVRTALGFSAAECEVRAIEAHRTGNVLLVEVERAEGRELAVAFGALGLRAERVAQQACDDIAAFVAAGVPVGEHLADQLLLPMAVAGGGRFRTLPLSRHATTNIETIRAFLDVPITVEPDGDAVIVSLG